MRILIHGINFAPELVGVGKYTGEMAEWLAARGHQVRAVTAPPFNPQWKVGAGFSGWRYSGEEERKNRPASGGLRVFRCPVWVPLRPRGANRILHLASFAFASLPVMLQQSSWKPDVVMAIEPTLFCLPAAWITARLCRARTWLHVQDFEADAGFELGLVHSARLRGAVEWVERKFLSGFGRVSTISEKMLGRLEQKGVTQSTRLLFPNWVDTDAIFPLPKPSPLRADLGISDQQVVALYAGTMAHKQGLEVLGEAASRLAGRADLKWVFCGEGPGRATLAAQTAMLANVQWIPMQPLDRLNHLLNLADIHLLPQKSDAADLVMPSKLTGMLASGRPVVATSGPSTQLARAVEGRGIVVEPGDPAAFAKAVLHLADNPRERERLGRSAREYALSELEKESVLSGFEQELLNFVEAC